jgi:hypothetical protein
VTEVVEGSAENKTTQIHQTSSIFRDVPFPRFTRPRLYLGMSPFPKERIKVTWDDK